MLRSQEMMQDEGGDSSYEFLEREEAQGLVYETPNRNGQRLIPHSDLIHFPRPGPAVIGLLLSTSVLHLQQHHTLSCLPLKHIHSTPKTHHFSHPLNPFCAQSTGAHPQQLADHTPIAHPQSPSEYDPDTTASPTDATQPSAHQPLTQYDHHHTTSPISLHHHVQPSAAASVSRKRSLHLP
ncbi:hypothetical protein PCANC_02669 [Puccinia coronata f. sp. avenae]|uniref:Uncharacterized protein n=1 Tax=Puccinia coronata f. sp. avenae TaxID=200324 RepID=A0A2N5W5L6_9BASI|nr:hypothetical protein PCASD_07167 [Puccinia coronata f. sp. avenae]PLW57510.1 hypothetical protein PCANC_02669 [Puccinia coronata f. sp. avenae]